MYFTNVNETRDSVSNSLHFGQLFLQTRNLCFQTNLGVPHGGNFSPLLTDMTMSYFEYISSVNYKLISNSIFVPIRCMDDLLIINNMSTDNVANILSRVYNNFQLEPTDLTPLDYIYLDFEIKIVNNKVSTNLYNKTDNFNFDVKRLPNARSFLSLTIKKATMHRNTSNP